MARTSYHRLGHLTKTLPWLSAIRQDSSCWMSHRFTTLAGILAFLAPVAMSAAWLLLVFRHDSTHDAARELASLQAEPLPQVLLLGNSAMNRNLEESAIKELFPGESVVMVWLPAAMAPTWHVILRNHVYARGQKPRLVFIVGDLQAILAAEPSGDSQRARLLSLSSTEPGSAASPGPLSLASEFRARSSLIHTDFLDWVRNTAVGLVFAPPGLGSVAQRGSILAESAFQRLFAEKGAALPEGRALLPTAAPVVEPVQTSPPATSLARAMVELVEDNGGQVVFVELPLRDEHLEDPLQREQLRMELAAFLEGRGVAYLDLHTRDLCPADFVDSLHVNNVGREKLTRAFLASWKTVGVTISATARPR